LKYHTEFKIMITIGLLESKTLVSGRKGIDGEINIDSLAPHRRYRFDNPSAPWNAPDPERPDEILEEDWNPDPINRDAESYLFEGTPMLWEPPDIVPLVKLDKPKDNDNHYDPVLIWFDDRVERDWVGRDLTPDEIAARTPQPDLLTTLNDAYNTSLTPDAQRLFAPIYAAARSLIEGDRLDLARGLIEDTEVPPELDEAKAGLLLLIPAQTPEQ